MMSDRAIKQLFQKSSDYALDLIQNANNAINARTSCSKSNSFLAQISDQIGESRGIGKVLYSHYKKSRGKRKLALAQMLRSIEQDLEALTESQRDLIDSFNGSCSFTDNTTNEDDADFSPDSTLLHGTQGLEGAVKVCLRYKVGSSGKQRCAQWGAGPGYAGGANPRKLYFSDDARKEAGLKRGYRYRKSLPYNPLPGVDPTDVPPSPSNINLAEKTKERFETLSPSVKSDILLINRMNLMPSVLVKKKRSGSKKPKKAALALPPPPETSED